LPPSGGVLLIDFDANAIHHAVTSLLVDLGSMSDTGEFNIQVGDVPPSGPASPPPKPRPDPWSRPMPK